jgi:hypothetical protein
MPLAFQSMSHREVAFGFFNVETNMILLNNYFFFSDDFCAGVSALADFTALEGAHVDVDSYVLAEKDVGNLTGAIHGFDFSGFIGETYRKFPFPREMERFRQSPDGHRTRRIIEDIITKYAGLTRTRLIADQYSQTFQVGPFIFERRVFAELLDYLWLGGMPRWNDGIRPPYVLEMKDRVSCSSHPSFLGLDAFH